MTIMSENKQEPIVINVMSVEWSDSPIHRGRFDVFLSYNRRRKAWSLYSRSGTLAWSFGSPDDDPRTVALELIGTACNTGALSFESIIYGGPFGLTLKDLP